MSLPVKPVTVTLSGEPWRVKTGKMKDCWGVTNFGTREITIDPRTIEAGRDREILIHEFLHVLYPQIDESVILAAGKELDDALETLGY